MIANVTPWLLRACYCCALVLNRTCCAKGFCNINALPSSAPTRHDTLENSAEVAVIDVNVGSPTWSDRPRRRNALITGETAPNPKRPAPLNPLTRSADRMPHGRAGDP